MACPPQSCCYCPGTPGPSGRPSPARSPSGRPSPGPRSPRGPLAHSSMRQRPDNSRQQHSVADETLNEINDLENLGILRRSQLDIHMRDEPGDELNLSHSHVLEVYPHEPRGGDDSLGIMDSRYMADERFAAADEYNYSGPDDLGPYPVHVMNELSSAGQGSPSRTPPRGPQRTPHAASPGRAAGSHMVTSTPTMRPNQSSCVCSPRSPAGRRAHDPSIMDSSHMARNMLGASNVYEYSGPDDNGPNPMQALRDLSGLDNSFGIIPQQYMDRHMIGADYDTQHSFQMAGSGRGHQSTGAPVDEISHALEAESRVTVYDPEDNNWTMAPRTSNLETRREVLFSTFSREIDEIEEEENEIAHEVINDFHERRRMEATQLSEE
ncbi:uncharacterized protein isoform X1 [Leptinotarsa decemlineata]|uniref:uncharacterized protein isoform X1 n=1 Tax=Leptinotarsa decemlineata TaxID=7539 RepID=UPI003D307FCA